MFKKNIILFIIFNSIETLNFKNDTFNKYIFCCIFNYFKKNKNNYSKIKENKIKKNFKIENIYNLSNKYINDFTLNENYIDKESSKKKKLIYEIFYFIEKESKNINYNKINLENKNKVEELEEYKRTLNIVNFYTEAFFENDFKKNTALYPNIENKFLKLKIIALDFIINCKNLNIYFEKQADLINFIESKYLYRSANNNINKRKFFPSSIDFNNNFEIIHFLEIDLKKSINPKHYYNYKTYTKRATKNEKLLIIIKNKKNKIENLKSILFSMKNTSKDKPLSKLFREEKIYEILEFLN